MGRAERRRLAELERHVVVVHISDPGVRQAYAELSTLDNRPVGRCFMARMIYGSAPLPMPLTRIS